MCMNKDQKANPVSERVLNAVRENAVEGKLSCSAARALAQELQVSTREVGDAANHLGIKIKACELGCF